VLSHKPVTIGVATGGYIGIYTPKSVYLNFFMWLFCILDPFIPTQVKLLATPLPVTYNYYRTGTYTHLPEGRKLSWRKADMLDGCTTRRHNASAIDAHKSVART